MKYSYNWLKELSGTKKTPAQIADTINMHAFELEETKKIESDTQLDFNILPNRAHDTLSHLGMAREICAIDGKLLKSEKIINLSNFNDRQSLKDDELQISIKEKALCPRYIGVVLENIEISPSPKWMRARLIACGAKPINNIVDITNYVMLETGQPLHAFDASVISEQRPVINIVVRRAKKGEEIKLLDEKIYKLCENDLVIADSEKALALAGVMGGYNSSITQKTKTIILEAANFHATNIRKTRTALGIQTESSYRFEREIDPNLAEIGAARAIELIQQLGGKNVKITAIGDIYSKRVRPWSIKLDSNYVKSLLGEEIPVAKMKNILENLGIKVKASKNIFHCEIPTRRIDLKSQEDLIEEIGRIYGYENIREKPALVSLAPPRRNEKREFENKLRDILAGLGFSEVYNYSFYGADDIAKCNLKIEDHAEVANPMNPDQQYMRCSMIPNLLKNVKLNLKYLEKFKIFEIGRKYRDEEKSSPTEIPVLAGVMADTKNDNPYFSLKGATESLLDKLGCVARYAIHKPKYTAWQVGRVAEILINGKPVGKIGEINPAVCKRYGIECRVALFGISIAKLLDVSAKEKTYSSISKFPSVKRDISMFVDEKTRYADIEKKILSAGGKLVLNVDLFDIFEKASEKSLALRLEIGSSAKTLTSAEIDGVMKKIISALEKELKVKVRK